VNLSARKRLRYREPSAVKGGFAPYPWRTMYKDFVDPVGSAGDLITSAFEMRMMCDSEWLDVIRTPAVANGRGWRRIRSEDRVELRRRHAWVGRDR